MDKANPVRTGGVVYAIAVLCVSATLSYGAVTAGPSSVTFVSPRQSATISLTRDGAPVPAKDIRGWRLLASGHDYKEMLSVQKTDGALQITPAQSLEVGSYDLNIETTQGAVRVQVLVPFSDLPGLVEERMILTGLSEKKIKEQLGLSNTTGREEIQIDLPAVYYEGQTLNLSMESKPGRACHWFMNGDLAGEDHTLSYTFKKTGAYILAYMETAQQNGQTTIMARAEAQTRVVAVPAIPIESAVGVEMAFTPPPGYRKHVWRIDDREVSTEPALKHAFPAPGAYTVECLASGPKEGPGQGFQRVRYVTTVKPE